MGQKSLAVLTRCFYKKMYGRLARRPQKSGRKNEVAVNWGFTVLLKPRVPNDYFTNETLHVSKFISINHGQIPSRKVTKSS